MTKNNLSSRFRISDFTFSGQMFYTHKHVYNGYLWRLLYELTFFVQMCAHAHNDTGDIMAASHVFTVFILDHFIVFLVSSTRPSGNTWVAKE